MRGRGTKLVITLLMHVAPPPADEFAESVQPQSALVVLALEDDELRAEIAEALTDDGHEVVTLKTGAELMQYLYNSISHQPQPDLVICGAALGGIDGAQVCKISRSQNELLPFIVLARPGEAGAYDELELGDDAVVFRSMDVGALRAAVARITGAP